MHCFLSIFNSLQRLHPQISSHPSLRLLFLLSPFSVKFSLCGSAGLGLSSALQCDWLAYQALWSEKKWTRTHRSPGVVVELCVHLPLSVLGFYISGTCTGLACEFTCAFALCS